jgi:hypothetical protein
MVEGEIGHALRDAGGLLDTEVVKRYFEVALYDALPIEFGFSVADKIDAQLVLLLPSLDSIAIRWLAPRLTVMVHVALASFQCARYPIFDRMQSIYWRPRRF